MNNMSQIATRHGCGLRSLNLPPRVFYDGIRALDLKINYTMSSVTEDSAQKLHVEQKTYQLNEKQTSCAEQNANRAHTNHVTFQRTFKVVYLGYAVLDRRYTLPMLPWVIAEIKRHGSQNEEEIYIEVTEQSLKAASCESNALVFEHKLQTISKFAQSSHDPSCFTYMTREVQNGPCAYHVFQANDENTVLELFTTIREVTKEMFNQQTVAQPTLKTASGTTLDSVISSCQQYEVLYLGRIKVSGKRAPPSFIDDAVEKFRLYELEKARNQQNSGRRRHGSGASISSLPHNLDLVERPCENGLKKHSGSRENLSSSSGVSSCESIGCKTFDTCSRICCDSCNEPQLQSPLSPLYSSEELDKFPKPDRSLVTHSQSMDIAAAAKMAVDMKSSDAKCNLMPPSSLITHTQSLDAPGCADIVRDLRDIDPSVMLRDRVRSCSGDIPRTKQTSLPTFGHRLGSGDSDMRRPRAYTSPSPSSNRQCNRTMLFLIGRLEICLIGMDKKQMLLSKTFNDIAHCSQGVKHLDHFGFICRETTLSGADCYAGYIFRCQTEKVVDEMMQTLKLAFSRAHQNYQQLASKSSPVPKLIVCDSCPMHWFHMLCSEVEGLSAEGAHLRILHRLGNLPDADKEEIMVKFQNADFSDVQEQNEVLMMLLREFSEQKQLKHIHVLNNCNGKNDSFLKEKGSKLDSFRQKAKKSISSSLETIFKLTNRDESKESGLSLHDDIPGTVLEDAETFSKDPDSRSYREGSYDGDHAPSGRVSPLLTRPRSSTFSSSREIIHSCKKNNSKHEMHRNNRRPIMNIFMKSGQIKPQTPEQDDSGPKGSWRQAIFHRVQTNIHDDHERNHETESPGEKVPKRESKKTKEELRALWRKAIIEQILLIRMEKENKNLQVNQDAASYKRMKLNYEEITPCIKSAAIKWEEILNDPKQHEELMDEGKLMELVKTGVPRHKRGEIWQFLAEQHRKIWDHKVQTDIDLSIPYEDLLKQLTSHQHSILIDIGRTFPNHPFYSQSLGAGQLSLFNLLKAYSLLDKEVGYCQGLSFVAGILLLHMPEEQAFSMMKYLMFDLGLRKQYKTDMVAFQVQMYQLSRLIHDNYRDLYEHLEKNDIAPTLYAAPWFLTLFASQFPVGFVSRLFDLIFLSGIDVVFKVSLVLLGNYKTHILTCDSFESTMDFLKTTLPSIDVLQMEIIFNQVFNLNISGQLHAYEVEYHVLLEEMIHSPSKNSAELETLEAANKCLKAQNMEFMEQLQVAYSRIHNLEASEASLKSTVRRLKGRIATLEDEKEALTHSLRIMKKRLEKLEKLEVARIEDSSSLAETEEEEEHPPPFGVVYALAGSEKEEDQQFKELMRKYSHGKEPEKWNEVFKDTTENKTSSAEDLTDNSTDLTDSKITRTEESLI